MLIVRLLVGYCTIYENKYNEKCVITLPYGNGTLSLTSVVNVHVQRSPPISFSVCVLRKTIYMYRKLRVLELSPDDGHSVTVGISSLLSLLHVLHTK